MTATQAKAIDKIKANGGWIRSSRSHEHCEARAYLIHFKMANRLESAGVIRRDDNYFTPGHADAGKHWLAN
jgi:hypothetical protein